MLAYVKQCMWINACYSRRQISCFWPMSSGVIWDSANNIISKRGENKKVSAKFSSHHTTPKWTISISGWQVFFPLSISPPPKQLHTKATPSLSTGLRGIYLYRAGEKTAECLVCRVCHSQQYNAHRWSWCSCWDKLSREVMFTVLSAYEVCTFRGTTPVLLSLAISLDLIAVHKTGCPSFNVIIRQ